MSYPISTKCAVLLPVYKNDNASFFLQAIESIEAQVGLNEKPRIYLGIDGHIPNNIEHIISQKYNSFYKIIRSKENFGLPNILNRLIENLESEKYIFRMDSDDICDPKRFIEQINYLTKNPEVGILGTALIEIDSHGNAHRTRTYNTNHQDIVLSMCKAVAHGHPTVCFRRETLNVLGKYREDLPYLQDAELWFRAAKLGIKLANLDLALVKFRLTPDTLKRRGRDRSKEEFKVFWHGTFNLYGFSWRLIYPLMRYAFRFLPPKLATKIYLGNLRNFLTR